MARSYPSSSKAHRCPSHRLKPVCRDAVRLIWAGALLALFSAAQAADPPPRAIVPVVHCAVNEDGSGAQATTQTLAVDLDPDAVRPLAYYAAAPAPGVLAPKGWSCHAWQGDSGSMVLVTPRRIDPPYFPLPEVDGAAVMIQTSDRTAGGRFHVAIVASQLFPLAAADFIQMIKQEHLISDKSFQTQSFPADQVRYLSDRFALYTTAPNQMGLGTESLFQPSDLGISGLTYLRLESDTEALTEVRVRVPRLQTAAGAAILQVETVCVQVPASCALPRPVAAPAVRGSRTR